MNMQAIVNGWLPEVRGWNTTVSDQFIRAAHGGGVLTGGIANPTVLEFPITYDGIYRAQFPPGSYFGLPAVNFTYPKGASQPDPQPVPIGYRARVNKVCIEIGWAYGGTVPWAPWDPGDYMRWSWRRRKPTEIGFATYPGAAGFPCQSRTLYGAPQFYVGVPFDTINAATPPAVRVAFTAGTGLGVAAAIGAYLVFTGGGHGTIESSYVSAGGAGTQVGFLTLRAGTIEDAILLTGTFSAGTGTVVTGTAGALTIVEEPTTVALSYQQLYHYPQAILPPIFLEPGDQSILRVENYTGNPSQEVAISVSVSGVMWPIGLEGS